MHWEVSKRQANVIYRAWKEGRIKADKRIISKIYYIAENGISGRSATSHDVYYTITNATALILKGGYATAQREIDRFASELEHYEQLERSRAESAAMYRARLAGSMTA